MTRKERTNQKIKSIVDKNVCGSLRIEDNLNKLITIDLTTRGYFLYKLFFFEVLKKIRILFYDTVGSFEIMLVPCIYIKEKKSQ